MIARLRGRSPTPGDAVLRWTAGTASRTRNPAARAIVAGGYLNAGFTIAAPRRRGLGGDRRYREQDQESRCKGDRRERVPQRGLDDERPDAALADGAPPLQPPAEARGAR